MPLFSLLQFHPRKLLEQESIKLRNVEARRVDERMMLTSDAAYLTFIGDWEIQRLREFVINAIAPRAGIN